MPRTSEDGSSDLGSHGLKIQDENKERNSASSVSIQQIPEKFSGGWAWVQYPYLSLLSWPVRRGILVSQV